MQPSPPPKRPNKVLISLFITSSQGQSQGWSRQPVLLQGESLAGIPPQSTGTALLAHRHLVLAGLLLLHGELKKKQLCALLPKPDRSCRVVLSH